MTSDTLSTASPSSASAPSSAQAQTQTPRPATRRVVDATTRMLHWLMALSFTAAYITADGERWRLVHVTLGYTLAGLVVARLLWGVFGPRQVRMSVLWRKLQGLPAWLKSLAAVRSPSALQATWRPGQNLLMALAVARVGRMGRRMAGGSARVLWQHPLVRGAGAHRADRPVERSAPQKPGTAHADGPRALAMQHAGARITMMMTTTD